MKFNLHRPWKSLPSPVSSAFIPLAFEVISYKGIPKELYLHTVCALGLAEDYYYFFLWSFCVCIVIWELHDWKYLVVEFVGGMVICWVGFLVQRLLFWRGLLKIPSNWFSGQKQLNIFLLLEVIVMNCLYLYFEELYIKTCHVAFNVSLFISVNSSVNRYIVVQL